ncbi:hypothetical protein TI39_contig359g00001 [Zymoseptoria brevis]|uniref:Uncharacterized protein n=1 Tax=Zymoseptoria brevis TaxID=1047168 RepID=A0A0F4GTA8_9PEZI|nr:hypothetical protein TI39_contig359g00001 [Zymoseptoria brevis]
MRDVPTSTRKATGSTTRTSGIQNLSREASLRLIESCDTSRALILLMNPDNEGERDKMYGWNFLNLLQSSESTIEFHRGSCSTDAAQVFTWIELAMSFIKASITLGTPENLRKVPSTVGGLKWFITAAKLPADVFDRRYLDTFFGRASENAAAQPSPVGRLSADKAAKLKRKKLEDKNRSIMLEKTLNPPYWG